MQKKNCTNLSPNTQSARNRKTQYKSKLQLVTFQMFRDQMNQNLADLCNQKQIYQQKVQKMQEQKEQAYRLDLLPEPDSSEQFERFLDNYELPIYPSYQKVEQKSNRKKYYEEIQEESIFEEGYESNGESSVISSQGQDFVVRVEEIEILEEQSENQSKLKQQQSTVDKPKFYVKIPDDNDFVIFGVQCPKIGISKQELLMKKGSLSRRVVNVWPQVKKQQISKKPSIVFKKREQSGSGDEYNPKNANKTKNIENKVSNTKQLKLINTSNIIPAKQNSTRMRTRKDDSNQNQQQNSLNLQNRMI